jgi:hypothetical protein
MKAELAAFLFLVLLGVVIMERGNASNYSAGTNANLSVWDQTDPEGGPMTIYQSQNVTFFANYTSIPSGGSITGTDVYCNITFGDTEQYWNMTLNGLLYEFNRSFITVAEYNWNVTCGGSAEYEGLGTNDTVVVTSRPWLEVLLAGPVNNKNVAMNSTFIVNATVICRDGFCGNVSGTARYNSSQNPDTNIPTLESVPFYVMDNANPNLNCTNNPMSNGDWCNITWTVNATGDVGTTYKIGTEVSSSLSYVYLNHTENSTVIIVSCIIDITLYWDSVNFGSVQSGSTANPAPGNAGEDYNITIEPLTTCNIDLYINSTDFVHKTDTDYCIPHDNITFSNTTNDFSMGYNLTGSWDVIRLDVPRDTNVTTYYWINAPYSLLSGEYSGTIEIEGVEHGKSP